MNTKTCAALALGALLAFGAGAAAAGEVSVGVLAHDTGEAQRESGADIQLIYRTERIDALRLIWKPQFHVLVQVNTDVDTDFIAAGLSWRIPLGRNFYVRPGIGLAYTSGKAGLPPVNAPGITLAEALRRLQVESTRKDFGSKELFEPELSVGYQVSPRWSVEANYTHYSNGQIFHHGTNQGLDSIGARLVYKLGVR